MSSGILPNWKSKSTTIILEFYSKRYTMMYFIISINEQLIWFLAVWWSSTLFVVFEKTWGWSQACATCSYFLSLPVDLTWLKWNTWWICHKSTWRNTAWPYSRMMTCCTASNSEPWLHGSGSCHSRGCAVQSKRHNK